MTSVTSTHRSRDALLRRIERLAPQILFGTLSETYRTCGRAGCHCHQGEKHGPHLYVSFRRPERRTQGYYVPQALAAPMRAGVAAWQELQEGLRALAEVNRQRLWASRGPRTEARRPPRRGDAPARIPPALAAEPGPRPARDAGGGGAPDAGPEASVRLELRRVRARGPGQPGLPG